MNIYIDGNIITSEELYKMVKRKWKERKRTKKESAEIRTMNFIKPEYIRSDLPLGR